MSARIILIDGSKLADLMIDYDVGVTAATMYVVKRINSDYFELGRRNYVQAQSCTIRSDCPQRAGQKSELN